MRKFRFPILEILIVISTVVLVWLLGYPQYEEKSNIEKKYRVRVNMYTLRAGVENYAAYNNGKFPEDLNDIKDFFAPALSPYTGKLIELKDIPTFQYTSKEEPKENTQESKNGRMKGEPGGLAYGYFMGADSLVSAYGIIGFDKEGSPLAEKLASKKIEVFVLCE